MTDFSLSSSEQFHQIYPEAAVGILMLEQVSNPKECSALNVRKTELENHLRESFQGKTQLRELPTLQAYAAYYKHFKKSYHVQGQLESVIFGGRSLPNVAALVEAMFMAELKNMLLTAGHDLDKLEMPICIDVARGDESYTLMNGNEQTLKKEDMYIRDGQGIISSVIYGPDGRTRIQQKTQRAIFVVYAPPGIQRQQIEAHFMDIQENIRLFAPEVRLLRQEIL